MSAKATPGPWCLSWVYGAIRHINKNVDYDSFWRPDDCDVQGCQHNSPSVRIHPEDAKLIAAAPALADALVMVLEGCGDGCNLPGHAEARAALRQAGRL